MKPLPVLLFFLLLTVGTRMAGTYVSPVGHVPGWDFNDYGVTPWNLILRGQTPFVFGWSSVLLAGAGLRYQSMVVLSIIGLLLLLFISIKRKDVRILTLIFFGIFLLGVPMNKAIEAGNPDLYLSVLFGIILLTLRNRTRAHSLISSILLGLLLGFFLNAKGFLILFVLAALVLSGPDIPLLVSFLVSFAAFALWPRIFGIKSGIFDMFIFAVRGSEIDSQTIFTQVHYGNNAIVSYVSNVLQAFDRHLIPTYIHKILTYAGSVILAFLVFIKPFIDEKFIFTRVKRSFSSFPFHLLVFTVCYIAILTLTAWSYDYRILYSLPLLFCFLGEPRTRHTTQLLYLSVLFLLTKSLFIPKDRIMTVFLYLHFYFLLRAAVSLLYNKTHETYRYDA